MFLTEAEILDTPQALSNTFDYFSNHADDIKKFFARYPQRKFVILGCGSSYMLSKSAAAVFAAIPDTTASAIPAGDYIVEPAFWAETVRGAVVILSLIHI